MGIVEKYEGGIIYTVEGNTGTNIGGNNVRGFGNIHILLEVQLFLDMGLFK